MSDYRLSNDLYLDNLSANKQRLIDIYIGTIIPSVLPEKFFPNYLLCNGQTCKGTKYSELTGNINVPDMRYRFTRGADDINGIGKYTNYGTSFAEIQLTVQYAGEHTHSGTVDPIGDHLHNVEVFKDDFYYLAAAAKLGFGSASSFQTNLSGSHFHTYQTDLAGLHTHDVVASGGDDETCPSNVSVNFYMLVN